MRTVKEVDGNITATEKTLAKLRADRVKSVSKVEKNKSIREREAPAALADNDAGAQERLAQARADCREAEQVLEDLDSALVQVNRQLDALKIEREKAERADHWETSLKVGQRAVDEAHLLDGAITALAELLKQHVDTLRTLTDERNKSGKPKLFRPTWLRRLIENKLNRAMPGEFVRHREFDGIAYGDFISNQISTEAVEPKTDEISQAS
jgi:hypothetical protein